MPKARVKFLLIYFFLFLSCVIEQRTLAVTTRHKFRSSKTNYTSNVAFVSFLFFIQKIYTKFIFRFFMQFIRLLLCFLFFYSFSSWLELVFLYFNIRLNLIEKGCRRQRRSCMKCKQANHPVAFDFWSKVLRSSHTDLIIVFFFVFFFFQ